MPIFKNQNSAVNTLSDECSTSAPTSTPICTLAGLSTKRREALQEMIYICFRYKDEPLFPNKDLYENVLKYLVVTVPYTPSGSSTVYQIPANTSGQALFNSYTNPSPTSVSDKRPELKSTIVSDLKGAIITEEMSTGYVAEVCSIFALYYATKTLAIDVGFSVDFTEDIDFSNEGKSDIFVLNNVSGAKGMSIDAKSEIFTRLVNSIFKDNEYNYFKKGLLNNSKYKEIAFKILNPINKFGYTRLYEPDNLYDKELKEIKYGDFRNEAGDELKSGFLNELLIACINESLLVDDVDKQVLKINKSEYDNEIAKNKNRGNYIYSNRIIDKLEKLIRVEKSKIISEISSCLFEIFLPDINDKPTTYFIAAGGGSKTKGLFGINNAGVLFFNYETNNTNHVAGSITCNRVNIFRNENLKKAKNQKIHLSAYGNDFPSPSTISFIDNSGNLQLTFKQNTNSTELNDVDNKHKISNLTSSPFLSKKIQLNQPIPNDTTIGYYNKNNFKEIEILDQSITDFYIEYIAAGTEISKDEVLLLVNIVEDLKPEEITVIISLDDLYDNDKFEITIDKINRLFTSEEDKLKIQQIVAFIAGGAIINTPQLYGNFIGESASSSINAPKVIPDEDFKFNVYPNDGPTNYEGTEDDDHYEPLRYSFAKITATATNVNIQIDSWVSPLRSRLDKRFTNDDYRTTTNYATFSSIFAPNPIPSRFPDIFTQPDINLLNDNYTLAPGTNQANWLYYLFTDPDDNTTTKIRSYNQVLATLRSFGLLEAVCYRIFDMGDQDVVLGNKLIQLLNNSNTESIDRGATVRLLPTTPNKNLSNTINYSQFNAFKWYWIYYRAKQSDGSFQNTSDFDYDKYRHSF